jgi:hypothetical protein
MPSAHFQTLRDCFQTNLVTVQTVVDTFLQILFFLIFLNRHFYLLDLFRLDRDFSFGPNVRCALKQSNRAAAGRSCLRISSTATFVIIPALLVNRLDVMSDFILKFAPYAKPHVRIRAASFNHIINGNPKEEAFVISRKVVIAKENS